MNYFTQVKNGRVIRYNRSMYNSSIEYCYDELYLGRNDGPAFIVINGHNKYIVNKNAYSESDYYKVIAK